MGNHTAVDEYGFTSYTQAYPGGMAVASVTDVGENIPNGVLPSLGFGHQNPLFWVLIIFLVISGYLSFGLDLKKIGSFKVGS